MGKIFGIIWRHKIKVVIIIIILGVGGYFGWKKFFPAAAVTRYVTSTVEKGVLSSTISGTGQVEASNSVDITAKISGDIVSVNSAAKAGAEVKSGTILASLDATDAVKAVRDAQTSLETAQLDLEELLEPTDSLTLLQSENSLAAAKESRTTLDDTMAKAYEDGFNAVANVFLDLPTIMAGLDDMWYDYDFDNNLYNIDWYENRGVGTTADDSAKSAKYRDAAEEAYKAARASYDIVIDEYKNTTRYSDNATIEELISDTYEMSRLVSDAVKNGKNFLDHVQDVTSQSAYYISTPSTMTTHVSSLENYTSQTNSNLSSLLSSKSTLTSTKNSIVSADRSIAEKTASLAKLKESADALEVRAQKITIAQRKSTLSDAQAALADYYIRAPFDGVLATFTAEKGDSVSANSSIGSLITKNQIATISLNEVDIAKVAVGQKATMTFDAIEDLTITGKVVEVDTVGATNSGVVSYGVTVAFDVQDARVKPGMTVTVNIILSSKADVLLVNTSAIKTANGESYVMVMASGTPEKRTVTTGDISDTQTEITSGLSEGETIVTQTITTGGTTSSGSSSSDSSGKSSSSDSSGPPGGGMMMGL
ncbi:MAG: efflux RND transporter periplasmic adaptor subunit [Patescibacteria group bacterium]